MFASKTPRDLNHDPEPFVDSGGYRTGATGQAYTTFAPRPEFDHVQHNPVNPILAEFRRDPHLSTTERARGFLLYLRQYPGHIERRFEKSQITHARAVLTRLANVQESHCLCDGDAYGLQKHPFLVHPKCSIHAAADRTMGTGA